MSQDKDKDMLGALRVPGAPDGLKPRVLEAATTALENSAGPSTWDLLWESRLLRTAWGVAVTGLLVAHVLISFSTEPSPSADTATVGGELEALRDELDLPTFEVTPRAEALIMEPLKDEVQG